MKISVNISVDLTIDEISFLRKNFDKNIDRSINIFIYLHLPGKCDEKNIYDSLAKKDILKKDDMRNVSLTTIGKLIMEKIDRGNIIDDILN